MTLIHVTDHLSFGDIEACASAPDNAAIVHACKDPCHRRACAYSERTLPKDHPHYLALERGHHLYLNLIDPPVPLFQKESFAIFFDFMDRQAGSGRPVIIHCNKGESRAPSLTLLYMAKRGLIAGDSFETARRTFEEKFPYKPGKGIEIFLTENWDALGARL